jgi:NAD(P)-dependent dehydrogenase (short-subunit alcohol dehydrogenase family)
MAVALVTGGSRGFGRAVALELAGAGWDLVVDARHAQPLAATAAELESTGVRVRARPGDLTDDRHRRELIEAAGELGGLELLVNNAGGLGPSPLPRLEHFDLEALSALMGVNVLAPLALVQLALPLLRPPGGTLVAVTSDAAVEAYEGWGGYGASKAAFEQLHHVLGTEEPNLRVIRFDPGDMRTQMHQDAFPGEDISDRPEPEPAAKVLVRLLATSPSSGRYRAVDLGGLLEPSEVSA